MKKKVKYISLLLFAILFIIVSNVNATSSLSQLQNTYPTGSTWRDTYYGNQLIGNKEYTITARECAGFAALMYNGYYGIDPYACAEIVYDVEQVQPGDIVRYNNDGHSVWVLSRNGENVQVAECNYDYNCSVRWYQTKSMNELRNGFNFIYKAPYVIGGTEPALTAPGGVKANLSGSTLNVSWNRPEMAGGYIVKVFSAESVAKNDFSAPVSTKDIKFPSITNTSMSFNETGEFYVYVYTKRGDRVSASGSGKIKIINYPITSVEVTSTETGKMIIGDKRTFTAKVLPENTTTADKSITWSVSNSSVASVSKDGVVTALKDGGTYLYAKASNGVTSEAIYINVAYTQVPIRGISISGSQWVYEGKTTQLTATISPNDATGDKTVKWYSDDESIANVDSNGLVTGVKEGETRIKAETVNGVSMSWKMTVKPGIKVTDLTLDKTNLELLKGNSEKLKATVSPYNATNKTVTWTSSNSNIATVDSNGNITAKNVGNAIITAKAGDISKTCNVKVYDVSINLSPERTHTFSKLTETLQLSASLSTNESTNFTWRSSNEKVLKVDQNGKVTPVAGGFANITVTDSKYGKTAGCDCYVQVPVTLSDGSKAYVGDMDKNGYFNMVDSSIILDAFNNGATADQILLGDINGDGMVNAVDSAFINDLYTSNRFSPGRYYKITGVTLNKTETTIKKGNSENLKATINPSNTTDSPKITWSSSNTNIATVDNNGKVTAKSKGTATITAKTSNGKTATCKIIVSSDEVSVKYRTHVQKEGWQGFVSDGETSGTSGKSLRLEGIKIEIEGPISGGIKYSTHVQKEGWQEFVENGALSGTTGKSLRLEGIKIELTGEIASKYDVYYRVHSQKFGWMGWAKNGEAAGTQGYGYRLEGIQIKLVKKGETAPTSSAQAFSICPTLKYTSYVEKEGWIGTASNGQISGTTGKGLRMEALKIDLNTNGITGGIKYTAHVQKQGWQDYVTNGKVAGTTGKGLRMEAIKIELTEEMAKKFDIYYRVHTEKFGWLGWAKNGEAAGTQGYGYRIEAMQIQILPKGSVPSGSIENAFNVK